MATNMGGSKYKYKDDDMTYNLLYQKKSRAVNEAVSRTCTTLKYLSDESQIPPKKWLGVWAKLNDTGIRSYIGGTWYEVNADNDASSASIEWP